MLVNFVAFNPKLFWLHLRQRHLDLSTKISLQVDVLVVAVMCGVADACLFKYVIYEIFGHFLVSSTVRRVHERAEILRLFQGFC